MRNRTLLSFSAGFLSAAACLLCVATGQAAVAAQTPEQTAAQILRATGVRGGLVVHLGCGDGRLTAALHAGDRYLVHGLDPRAENVEAARAHVRSLGLYGKVSLQRWTDDRLPYTDNLVNLVVAEDLGRTTIEEVLRVLVPGGVAYVGQNGRRQKTVKPWPEQLDQWTHWLHGADGNAVSQDTIAGPPRGLQWVAKPLWSRHHNTVPSLSAMVSAAGRIFYIVDEAPPGMHGDAPDKWALTARDAFNGVLLWRIPLAKWGWKSWSADWKSRFTVPTQLPRRLVAVGDRVYATCGFNAPLSEIDAATGEVTRTFEGTEFTDEILHSRGLLLLSINKAAQAPGLPDARRKGEEDAPPVRKWVAAVEADTGKMLWKTGDFVGLRSKTGSMDRISHLSMCAGDGQVFFVDGDQILSLAVSDGKELWRAERPEVPEHKMRYDIRITDMCSLVYHDGILFFAQLNPDRRIDWREIRGKLHAFSAASGKQLWSRPCASWGWGHPADVFVRQGLVWVHDFKNPFILGLDPATGQQRRKISNFKAFDNGHHHRCYRNKATERFMMTSYRGLEFIEWDADKTHLNHWVRGTCRLGAFPCNGLIYAPPHPCECYVSAKLSGLFALAPTAGVGNAPEMDPKRKSPRFVRGPAYGKVDAERPHQTPDGWTTYRHDPQRSGTTTDHVSAQLRRAWEADLGGVPSSCTIAGGKIFAASVDTHDVLALSAEDGKRIWRFAAGGPVDTPPTIHGGLALFGSADGRVYCLRASDGELVWSLRAAPEDRLLGAFGGLQSAWPVHGSVLVSDDTAYAVAGRSSFLDGGLFAYALNPRTGKVLSEKNIRTSYDMAVDQGQNKSTNYGSLTDVLLGDGDSIYMRQLRLFGPAGESEMSGRQVRSTAGLLDDSWFNRTHWFLDDKPRGELLVYDDQSFYAVKAYATLNINSGFLNPGTEGYELYAGDRRPVPATEDDTTAKNARRKKGVSPPRWSVRVPVRITAMVLAGKTLFAAGTPDTLDAKEPWAAHEGRRGGRLLAFSAADGKKLAEYRLSSGPVADGMAAAAGRLFLATRDGRILCFAGE